jgi:hypothetical protein
VQGPISTNLPIASFAAPALTGADERQTLGREHRAADYARPARPGRKTEVPVDQSGDHAVSLGGFCWAIATHDLEQL